jgi:predicted CXXCH cytochrome family protein
MKGVCVMSTMRIVGILTGLCLLICVGVVSATDSPHVGNLVGCSSCHTVHHAAGPSLTGVAGNANLCMSCHISGGVARNKPFSTSMQPAGASKSSHSWSGSMPNSANDQGGSNPYGLRTDDQVADSGLKTQIGRFGTCSNGADTTKAACASDGSCSTPLYTTQATCTANGTCNISTYTYTTELSCQSNGGVWTANTWTPHTPGIWTAQVVCSTCHAVMSQAYSPWDPFATPAVSGTATGGSPSTVSDSTKSWTVNQWAGYYVLVPNNSTGVIYQIGGNTAGILTLANGETFVNAVSAGTTYGIQAKGRHYMRTDNDLNQMCEDCHYYRTPASVPQGGVSQTDVRTWDGNKKSHPVMKNISTDVANASLFVGTAPYEPNCTDASCAQTGAPRYQLNGGSDANPSNNIVFDSNGKIRCLSCHGIHYTDSNSSTVDKP